MTDIPLWQKDASEIAGATQNGDISAETAVQVAVEHMRRVNRDLNAVVVDLGDSAVQAAVALDKARRNGKPCGPLHGVPVTVKINVDQAGQATSNGIVALGNHMANADAPVVRNLIQAGAVIIGRSSPADANTTAAGIKHDPNPIPPPNPMTITDPKIGP